MKVLVRLACFIRALMMPLVLVVFTGFCSVAAIGSTFLIRNRKIDTWIVQFWCKGICFFVGIRVRVKGLENIPPGGVLYVFNHQSLLDIPVIHSGILRDFRFGAKLELFKVPLFGSAMKRLGALKIARSNRADAIQVLEEAAKKMNDGYSFVLAPEGTRQKEPVIGEFKTGPFVMAIQAKRPVVPLVINGIYKILPKKALLMNTRRWFCDIDLLILKPVDGAEFNFENRVAFRDRVRDAMKLAYVGPGNHQDSR